MFLVDLIFEWYGYAMISYSFIYLFIYLSFCLEATLGKDT